jgi:hypothetical protein
MQDVYAIADNVPHTTRHRICAATMQSRGARTTPASEKTTLRRIRTPTPPNSTILQASSRLAACLRTTAMSERAEQSIRPGARGRAAGCELHWCQHVYLCGLVITWECVRMIRYDRASGLPSPTNGLIKNASKGGQKVFSGHTRPHSLQNPRCGASAAEVTSATKGGTTAREDRRRPMVAARRRVA